jgi:hypothetical protein
MPCGLPPTSTDVNVPSVLNACTLPLKSTTQIRSDVAATCLALMPATSNGVAVVGAAIGTR